MAVLTYTPDREFLAQLGRLEEVERYAPKMLAEAAPILQEQLKRNLSKHVMTGSMVKSIKPTTPAARKGEYYVIVRPTGKGPGKKGTRNMEKLTYLENGTKRQPARPVIARTVNDARAAVERKMQEVFERESGA